MLACPKADGFIQPALTGKTLAQPHAVVDCQLMRHTNVQVEDGILWQHRIIPALRLKRRSGGCGTASALPKFQYYLRFWLSICRTSLAVSALRIMRYCLIFSLGMQTVKKLL